MYNEQYFQELTVSGILTNDWLLFDTGAAADCCPENYATDYPLLPVGTNPPTLRTVTKQNIIIEGRRLVGYNFDGSTVYINYYVTNVPYCVVAAGRLLSQGFRTELGRECTLILPPTLQNRQGLRHIMKRCGPLMFLTPPRLEYQDTMKDVTHYFHLHQSHSVGILTDHSMTPTSSGIDLEIAALRTGKQDDWTLHKTAGILTRTHKVPRKALFVPTVYNKCPVALHLPDDKRVTHTHYLWRWHTSSTD